MNRIIGKSSVNIGRFSYEAAPITIIENSEGAALNIGSFCSIASDVTVFLGNYHRSDWISTYPFGHIHQEELDGTDIVGHPHTKGDVNIGHDVWIGRGATIMSGITIGDGAIIAANSHIVKNVFPYEMVGGNPARHIKYRFDIATVNKLVSLKWWELPIEMIKKINKDLCNSPSPELIQKLIEIKNDWLKENGK